MVRVLVRPMHGVTNQRPVARIVTYRWKPSVSYRATLTGVIITRNRIGTGSNTYQETLTVIDGAGLKNSLTKTISFRN